MSSIFLLNFPIQFLPIKSLVLRLDIFLQFLFIQICILNAHDYVVPIL